MEREELELSTVLCIQAICDDDELRAEMERSDGIERDTAARVACRLSKTSRCLSKRNWLVLLDLIRYTHTS